MELFSAAVWRGVDLLIAQFVAVRFVQPVRAVFLQMLVPVWWAVVVGRFATAAELPAPELEPAAWELAWRSKNSQ